MNDLVPQWMDLESAVAYLFDETRERWNISKLLELGRRGELSLYAVVPDDSWIQYWDMSSNNPVMKQMEIADPLRLSSHQIYKMQKSYPLAGYEILVESQLPARCSYDLPEFYPIFMRMASKDFSRGVVIRSHEALRVSGPELDAFIAGAQSLKALDGGNRKLRAGAAKELELKPWNIQDDRDPKPAVEWYTPARYFARKFVSEDITLVNKRDVLCQKIADALPKIGVYKRGGIKPLDPGTIKKAIANINFG